MAFVFKAERNIVLSNTEDAKNQNLGPGSYQVNKPGQKQYNNRPPFLTQTGRSGKANHNARPSQDMQVNENAAGLNFFANNATKAKSSLLEEAHKTGFTPGPGSYNVTNGFDQIHRDMESAKTLQGFGLDQFGIQFVKPNTCFASRVKRFQGGELAAPKNDVPGPGQYYKENEWTKKQRTETGWKKGGAVPIFNPNPPSIPSHNNVFGYEENARGMLIKQKNTELVHTGDKTDKVGPGEYEVNIKKTTKGPTRWVKPNEREEKGVLQPGPGHYQPPQSTLNPIYKNNKTSVFASRVPRVASSTAGTSRVMVVAKSTVGDNKYKEIKQAAMSPTATAMKDVLESDDDDIVPGPGAYYHPSQSSFKPETKPQRLQFFGSTVERFTDQSKFKANDKVGPTTYQVNNGLGFMAKTATTKRGSRAGIAFQAGSERFAGSMSAKNGHRTTKTANQPSAAKLITPGPGQYDDGLAMHLDLAQQVMKKSMGNRKPFNCEEKRHPEFNLQDTPGPGNYFQNLEAVKKEEIKRSSSMFISKTKRNTAYQQIVKKTKQNPGLERVCYDDKRFTIAENVRKNAEQINNPLLASLTSKNNTTMAFSTNAPRFQAKVVDEETYIGPGYYEQKSCFDQSRTTMATRAKTGGQQTTQTNNLNQARSMQQIIAMQTTAKMGQGPKRLNATSKTETPGPGHYSQPDLNRWFKKSYNMNFSEV